MRKPRKNRSEPAEPAQATLLHLLIDDPVRGPTRTTIPTRGWAYNPNTTLHDGVVLEKKFGPIPAEQDIPATGLVLAQFPDLAATLAEAFATDISFVVLGFGAAAAIDPIDLFADGDD